MGGGFLPSGVDGESAGSPKFQKTTSIALRDELGSCVPSESLCLLIVVHAYPLPVAMVRNRQIQPKKSAQTCRKFPISTFIEAKLWLRRPREVFCILIADGNNAKAEQSILEQRNGDKIT